jgi:hypothetical protein
MSLTATGDTFILQNKTKREPNISAVVASGVTMPGTKRRLIVEGWMTDYSELVERMRSYPANKLCIQIANALEAQAKEIAEKATRIAELEAALRPFAVEATLPPMPGESDDPRICSKKYLIAAHAALKGEK